MKGTSMNFLIGLGIALLIFGVLATTILPLVLGAGDAASGCGPLASIVSDVSAGAIQPC